MNKLVEMSKLFEISLDELVNNIESPNSESTYKESSNERNNKKISIKIFILGIIIALVLCGIGFFKQNDAKRINEERKQQATEQSQAAVDKAEARLKEIEQEIVPLQKQSEEKQQERDSLNMRDSDWFENVGKLNREIGNITSQVDALEQEKLILINKDYRVFYQEVEPITYNIFYYIGAGVFALMSLIALIYFLVTRKK